MVLKSFSFLFMALIISGCFYWGPKIYSKISLSTPKNVSDFLPKNCEEIKSRAENAKIKASKELKKILEIKDLDITFDNFFRKLDSIYFELVSLQNCIGSIPYFSPSEDMRKVATGTSLELAEFLNSQINYNIELYNKIKVAYQLIDKSVLTQEQIYWIEETIKDLRKMGLDLDENNRKRILEINSQLTALSSDFNKNISEDSAQRFILCTKEELEGLAENAILGLPVVEGKYKVGVDYPTYTLVVQECKISDTRKRLVDQFLQRGYPVNVEVLSKIVNLRDELANILGFESYAALNISDNMAKTVKTVEDFLKDLNLKSKNKAYDEVKLVSNGQSITSSDLGYLINEYKKKNLQIDERKISEYFPMDNTIDQLLDIYSQFFSLEFAKETPVDLWTEDLVLLRVSRNNKFLGYIILDLYPRENKFTHACEIEIVSTFNNKDIQQNALIIVLANFTKPTSNQPSLLQRNEVQTFFHEFGHAIHSILSNTELFSTAGTKVKKDFVEMPSQMLENWLFDKDILKKISKHYITGESLDDATIDRIIESKNLFFGCFLQRQLSFATASLEVYKPGKDKNLELLSGKIFEDFSCGVISNENIKKSIYSFGHLTGYGAAYYGYAWSEVYSEDMFQYIKKSGLLNPQMGDYYASTVLSKGGSCDPMNLLQDFLKRSPSTEAFFKSRGL